MAGIIVGSVGVQLVPSADGFSEKARSLLRGLSVPVKLDVDDTEARTQLEEFTRPRETTVNVNADTGAAETQIAALGAESAAAGGRMNGLLLTALALGPALIPVTAAAVGLGVALTAPLAAAAGGLTLFGFLAGKAAKDIPKNVAQMTAAQKAFVGAKSALSGALSGVLAKNGGDLLGPLTKGMQILAGILPKVSPLIHAVSGALDSVLTSIGKATSGKSFSSFIDTLSKLAGPAIKDIAGILANIAKGFGSMAIAAAPLGTKLLDSLKKMTAGFAGVGKSNGFQGFLAYVQKVGPQVAKTLKDTVGAVANIVKALAPLGKISLGALEGLAKVIKKIPAPVLGAIGAGLLTMAVGAKAFGLALKGFEMIQTLVTGVKMLAGSMLGLDVAMDANPIGAVVIALTALAVGLVYAYKHSQTFRNIVNGVFHAVANAGKFMWNVLKASFRFIVNAFLDVVGAIIHGAADAFGWVPGIGGKLKDAASAFDTFKNNVNTSLNGIVPNKTVTISIVTARKIAATQAAVPSGHVAADPGMTHRALGGPVTAGKAYIVGEHRPEVFVPEQNGRIISSIQKAQSGTLVASPAGGSVDLSGAAFTLVLDDGTPLTGYISDIADDRVRANNTMQQQTVRASR